MNRLFEIIYLLIERQHLTAQELADKFEVSVRTIYRDIDKLTLAGIPIYTVQGKNGGIHLLDNFVLNKSLLSNEERNQILMGLQTISATKNLNVENTISKLNGLFKTVQPNWIKVDYSSWENNSTEFFSLIENSILNHVTIKFSYYNNKGEYSERTVEPLQLLFKSRTWYLIGYCKIKHAQRTFKLTRMEDIEQTTETFPPRAIDDSYVHIAEENWENASTTIKLKIDNSQAYRIFDEFNRKCIEKTSDGNYIVTFSFPLNEWTYNYILSFGCSAVVMEPKSLKNTIKEKLEKTLSNYL